MSKAKKTTKKATHGGPNRGQGRHGKYGEPTESMHIRCPVSKTKKMRSHVNELLKSWELPPEERKQLRQKPKP